MSDLIEDVINTAIIHGTPCSYKYEEMHSGCAMCDPWLKILRKYGEIDEGLQPMIADASDCAEDLISHLYGDATSLGLTYGQAAAAIECLLYGDNDPATPAMSDFVRQNRHKIRTLRKTLFDTFVQET